MAFNRLLTTLAVLSVIMHASQAAAVVISEIRLNVSGSGLAWVTEDFTVYGNETLLDFTLPVHSNLVFSSNGGVIPYSSKSVEGGIMVSLNLEDILMGVKQRDLSMSYETQHLTSKNGSIWSMSFSTEATPRKTIVKLYLPKNSTILLNSLRPREVLFSVDRDSLWLYPQEVEFNFTCNYEYAGEPAVTPGQEDGGQFLPAAALFAGLLASAAVLYYFLRRKGVSKVVSQVEMSREVVSEGEPLVEAGSTKKAGDIGGIEFEFKTEKTVPQIKETVLNILNEEEKNIVVFIRERWPEDITQASIYKTMRMPKSSLSEVIKRLEKRNVIECRREGRLNWIKLKKWILD